MKEVEETDKFPVGEHPENKRSRSLTSEKKLRSKSVSQNISRLDLGHAHFSGSLENLKHKDKKENRLSVQVASEEEKKNKKKRKKRSSRTNKKDIHVINIQKYIRLYQAVERKNKIILRKNLKIKEKFGHSEILPQILTVQSIIKTRLTRLHPTPAVKSWNSRKNIIAELLSTEESYYQGLECLTDIYFTSMTEIPDDILDKSALQKIFNDILVIKRINKAFLDKLRERMENFFKNQEKVNQILVKCI